jgi:hypothetical protein
MNGFSWSASEKKLARHAFDMALEAALAKTMAEFKRKASAVTQPSGGISIGCSITAIRS